MSKSETFAVPAAPADAKSTGETAILDNEEIGKTKERRKQRQREEIAQKLKNQGIDLGDDGNAEDELENFYDTKSEVKKEDGVTIEPFRMDGFFNRDGRYVERSGEENDPWYKQWEEQKDGEGYKAPKVEESESTKQKSRGALELRETLLKFVKPGETVLRALKRLGKRKASQQPRRPWQKKKRKGPLKIVSADGGEDRRRSANRAPMDTGGEVKAGPEAGENAQTKSEQQKAAMDAAGGVKKSEQSLDESKRRKALDELTSAANELMSIGHNNVYQDSYAVLDEFVKKAKASKAAEVKEWEYKFVGQEKIHTGFTATQMQRWNNAQYFKSALVRKVGTQAWLKCETNFEFE